MSRLQHKKIRIWSSGSIIIISVTLFLSLFLPRLFFTNPQAFNPSVTESGNSPSPSPIQILAVAALVTPSATVTSLAPASPTATLEMNCTYTMHHWQSHPEDWLVENIVIDRLSYDKTEALAILKNNSTEVHHSILKQFFPAILNTLKGAEAMEIEATLVEASAWLNQHPLTVRLSDADRQAGIALVQRLEEYNLGIIGPGPCRDEASTPIPTVTATSTPTETATNTPTRRVILATATPTDTRGPDQPAAPVNTPEPTPTNTLSPTIPPTATAQPPQPPSPTQTPPNTAVPTERPTPTLLPTAIPTEPILPTDTPASPPPPDQSPPTPTDPVQPTLPVLPTFIPFP